MSVFIAGPVTGEQNQNQAAFRRAQNFLNQAHLDPICWLDRGHREDQPSRMRGSLKQLMHCNAIYLLPGWQTSQGAQFELKVARMLGLDVWEEKPHDQEQDLSPQLT